MSMSSRKWPGEMHTRASHLVKIVQSKESMFLGLKRGGSALELKKIIDQKKGGPWRESNQKARWEP
jgi:hypothetical protein